MEKGQGNTPDNAAAEKVCGKLDHLATVRGWQRAQSAHNHAAADTELVPRMRLPHLLEASNNGLHSLGGK